jgi:P4 family phage/plasmid primase-like protien
LKITWFESVGEVPTAKRVHDGECLDLEWRDFVALLANRWYVGPKDFGPGWSPTWFAQNHRVDASACDICILGMDFDHVSPDVRKRIDELVESFACVIHSTARHWTQLQEDGTGRLRVTLPLKVPIPASCWKAVYRALLERADLIDPADSTKDIADRTCGNPSRFFFAPSSLAEEDRRVWEVHSGDLLDLSELVAEVQGSRILPPRVVTASAASDFSAPAPAAAGQSVDMDALRKALQPSEFFKTHIHDGQPIGAGRGSNHDAFMRVLGDFAWRAVGFPHDAVLELLRPAFNHPDHYGTDPEEEFWLIYPKSQERWTEKLAEMKAEEHEKLVALARSTEKMFQRVREANTPEPAENEIRTIAPIEALAADCNEMQLAEQLAIVFADTAIRSMGQWLVWDGSRFDADDRYITESRVVARSTKFVRELRISAIDLEDDSARRVEPLLRRAATERGLMSLISLTEKNPLLQVSPRELDKDQMLLNVRNGIVDLHTGQLLPHDRKRRITKLAPVTYDPAATAPRWEQFISETMGGSAGLVNFMQRVVGYTLTGSVQEHVLFFLYGDGSNGKSTFCETMIALLGDYGMVGSNNLLDAHGQKYRDEPVRLMGARFASFHELRSGMRLDESVIKKLVSGDHIVAKQLYKSEFIFSPTHKMFISGNSKPTIADRDTGIWRRMRLVPFTVRFDEGQVDKQLDKKLAAELPGILNWAIEGCLKWQKDGLQESAEVRKATQEYRNESDLIREFLEENYVKRPGNRLSTQIVYDRYKQWAEDNGERVITKNALGKAIRCRADIHDVHSHGKPMWSGLSARRPESEEPASDFAMKAQK